MTLNPLAQFIHEHQLPDRYLTWARTHFAVLLTDIQQQHQIKKPVIVMINGSQGSGKSTLAAYLQAALVENFQLTSVCLSLDDFYHTRATRQQLARDTHPLLATRGVPGTHDIALALNTLDSLKQGNPTSIVRFDKGTDDRAAETEWQIISNQLDVILIEGWCMGATPQTEAELKIPINDLEKTEDEEGIWRRFVNQQLSENYHRLFSSADISVMLKAPSFDAVFAWRWQQEQKLAEKLLIQYKVKSKVQTTKHASTDTVAANTKAKHTRVMNKAQVARFIQHYQRLTEHMLRSMPAHVTHCYELDEQRGIINEQHRQSSTIP